MTSGAKGKIENDSAVERTLDPDAMSNAPAGVASASPLIPYVSRLSIDWLAEAPDARFRAIEGTLAFVEIIGIDRLTELLAGPGRSGAGELTEHLDATFAALLGVSRRYGAELVKWGGDAVSLLYTGHRHADRSVAAALVMQRLMGKIGHLLTSAGRCTLRMSVGAHSGSFDFMMLGEHHRELVLTGPATTVTGVMAAVAEAGEIVVSPATAALVAAGVPGEAKGPGCLIAKAPRVRPVASSAYTATVDPVHGRLAATLLSAEVREHLGAGPVPSEERPVAVGFIEFSGMDGLIEREGPDRAVAALEDLINRIQDSCARHGVTFWETGIGQDGGRVMLVAGAPKSSGDDAGRLLAVVRHVMDHGGALSLRAGVDCGRVFAGNFGPDFRRTYAVMGDAVNLAARLMDRAEPGHIYVSEAVISRAPMPASGEPVEPFYVRGRTEPVQAHRLGPASSDSQTDAAANFPVIGRDDEMQVLDQSLDAAGTGRGSCIQLSGPPGIGKSRLIEEVIAHASGFRVLKTVCDEYRATVPYAPVRDLARQALGLDAAAGPAKTATVLKEAVQRLAPGLLPWLAPLAGVVDTRVEPSPQFSALDERFRRVRLEEAFLDLLRALLPASTLFVIDDVHWMDDASVDLIRRLIANVGQNPWLILTGRGSHPGGLDLSGAGPVTRLEVPPLSEAASARLLRLASEESPLSSHQMSAVASRGGGNPLFLLKLVTNSSVAGSTANLPDNLEGILAVQVDRLAPPDRDLLGTAAVIGARVDLPVLSAMLDSTPHDAPDDEQLGRVLELLTRDGPGGLRFRHGMIRDAAYGALPFFRRRELHERAARVLELQAGRQVNEITGLLAVHFGLAGNNEAAWRYARTAAERALAVYADVEAAAFYEQALTAGRARTGTPPAELVAVAETLGDVRARLGQFAPAEADYGLAQRWAPDAIARARILYKAARASEHEGDYPKTLRILASAERCLRKVPTGLSGRLRAEITCLDGMVRFRQGRPKDAVRSLIKGLDAAEAAGAADVMASVLSELDSVEAAAGLGGEGGHARRALEILQDLGDHPWLEARVLNNLGYRAYFAGRWPEAARYYSDCIAACQRAGDRWTASLESAYLAEVLSDQGYLSEAEPMLEAALRTSRAHGTEGFTGLCARLLGRVAARLGDHARAESLLKASGDACSSGGDTLEALHTDAFMAECRYLSGAASDAIQLARRALEGATKVAGGEMVIPLLQRIRALGLIELGQKKTGREALRAGVESARQLSLRYELAVSLQALLDTSPGDVSGDERDECQSLFELLGVVEGGRRVMSRRSPSPDDVVDSDDVVDEQAVTSTPRRARRRPTT
jgi:class 3 adenylate cyclase/tetratricopeptide (TPR) repeat protein